jgi:subtilisin-like proprotein convertase family protein
MRSVSLSMACLAAFAALAAAQDKAAIRDQLSALDGQYLAARALGHGEAELAPLLARRAALAEQLGGGDPALAARAAQAGFAAQLQTPSNAAAPRASTALPPGAVPTALSFADAPNLAIVDGALVSDTQVVAGVTGYLWDVDLYVDISHTWCGDLELHLVAPSGRRVTIVTDVAEGFADVFRGTLFDDSPDAPAWVYPHFSGFASPLLNPEGALHWLSGENPNGTWRLDVRDDALGDVGVLHAWRLDFTTLAAPPHGSHAPQVATSTPGLNIADFATTSDSIVISGHSTNLSEVRVFVDFTHAWNSDVRFDLVGPSGRRARLSTFNGGALDNVFAGTSFFDRMGRLVPTPNPLQDQPIDSYPFANNVAALQGQPEGALTSFIGDDPNGTWRLELVDTVGGFTGTLVRWDLSLTTYLPYVPPPVVYCPAAGPSAGGCQPTIAATANPDVAQANACVISILNVDGQRSGIIFYGAQGPTLKSWCSGGAGNSKMCVKAPTQRTNTQSTGGTLNQCDGALGLDWNVWQLAHPGALGNPWFAGSQAHVQGWFRSPADCKTTFLTPALELTYQP